MEYKGYTITAEVQTYDRWTIDENGTPQEWDGELDGFEVTGYHFDHDEDNTLSFFQSMSETDGDGLKQAVDLHLAEVVR